VGKKFAPDIRLQQFNSFCYSTFKAAPNSIVGKTHWDGGEKLVSKVVHFEISAEKPKRTVKSYPKIFNCKTMKWAGTMDSWLATTRR